MSPRGVDALLLLTACTLVTVAGCAGGGLPTTHYYTLAPPQDTSSRAAGSGGEEGLAIGVESLAVDPPYDQDRIVYRRSPESTEVGYYAYHRWAAPIGRLVQSAMVEGLRGTEGIDSIEPATSTGDYDARLGGRVLFLEHIDSPSDQGVRVSVKLELRDEEQTLWSATLSAIRSGDMLDASTVAAVLARAVEELVERAREQLTTALSE